MARRMWPVFPLSCLMACISTLLVGQESFNIRVPTTDAFEFSDSVLVGIAAGKYAVTFDSNSFAGIERIKTKQGFEFRRHGGAAVTDYPDTIKVVIHGVIGPEYLYQLKLRWLDSSHRVIGEKSGQLREVVEIEKSNTPYPWPEIGPIHHWYEAEIWGIKQLLATDVELEITETDGSLNSMVRGKPFTAIYRPPSTPHPPDVQTKPEPR